LAFYDKAAVFDIAVQALDALAFIGVAKASVLLYRALARGVLADGLQVAPSDVVDAVSRAGDGVFAAVAHGDDAIQAVVVVAGAQGAVPLLAPDWELLLLHSEWHCCKSPRNCSSEKIHNTNIL